MRGFSIICPHYERHNLGHANCHGLECGEIQSRRRRTRERDREFELESMAAATDPFSARLRAANPLATRHLNSLALVSKPNFLISVSRAAPLHTRFRGARLPSLLPVIRAQSSLEYTPDAEFYKIEAIVRPWRVHHVSSGLLQMGIRGVTVSDVRGFGAQGGSTERHGGSEFSEDKFIAKVKMEIVVCKDQVEAVVEKIIEEARTGEIGDGKIFLIPVSDVIRVRTGERGEKAERMSGGRADMMSLTASID
ncbi:Nitrogen regulatory protein P-II [Musa troglodytarum]|uniref:Nitrogen regulatory protein P-II n=2 Tax=Musa troglodytarum TaxID=320322 RepID=A0A9E7GRR7_9LILI|nr:Nitrogen regulatory protein P-II [Musa troglodytarum]URE17914.1 Nitrogen regulatory protein P-II [Musa troglodytarum]